MKAFIQFNTILLLFVCVRSADLAITAALAHSTLRAIAYGATALLALIALILALVD